MLSRNGPSAVRSDGFLCSLSPAQKQMQDHRRPRTSGRLSTQPSRCMGTDMNTHAHRRKSTAGAHGARTSCQPSPQGWHVCGELALRTDATPRTCLPSMAAMLVKRAAHSSRHGDEGVVRQGLHSWDAPCACASRTMRYG